MRWSTGSYRRNLGWVAASLTGTSPPVPRLGGFKGSPNMNEISERLQAKKILRGKYLNALYDATDGHSRVHVDMFDTGTNLGFTREEVNAVAIFLKEEGLLEFVNVGGSIAITHQGVREVEQAREEPTQPTEHFPALNIIIGNINNSQVSQSSPSSQQKQTGTFTLQNNADIDKFVSQLKANAQDLGLDAEQLRELHADLGTLQSKRQSSGLKAGIVREALS